MSSWKPENPDTSHDRFIGWMQDYYPERLGKLFIVDAPYMFMKVWKVVYPFIDDNTKKKVILQNRNFNYQLLYKELGPGWDMCLLPC